MIIGFDKKYIYYACRMQRSASLMQFTKALLPYKDFPPFVGIAENFLAIFKLL